MRKRLDFSAPTDVREIVDVPGIGTMTCERYKAGGAEPTMRAVDAMPPSYRRLVHEFGMDVWGMWRRGMSTDEIRREIGRRS